MVVDRNQGEGIPQSSRHQVCIDAKVIGAKASFPAIVTSISGSSLELQTSVKINPKARFLISILLQQEFVFYCSGVWILGDFVDSQWIYQIGLQIESISFRNVSANTPQEKSQLVQEILPQIKAKGTVLNVPRKLCA